MLGDGFILTPSTREYVLSILLDPHPYRQKWAVGLGTLKKGRAFGLGMQNPKVS